MTLRRRLVFLLLALVLWLVVTAGVGLWGVNGLKQDYSVALQNYEQLRLLYQVGFHLSLARQAVATGYSDVGRAQVELDAAIRTFDEFAGPETSADLEAVKQSLRATREQLKTARGAALDLPMSRLAPLVDRERNQVVAMQQSANDRRRRTFWLLGIVSAIAVGIAILIGHRLYRAVMVPLLQLSLGARQLATRSMSSPLAVEGADQEFVDAAHEFNQMSRQLQTLYENLNQRVASATRQLVQSERLAGVGYLAAGVAHEINNPLAMIQGYCELWLKTSDPASAPRAIQISYDEARRCRAIVDKLLSLARESSSERQEVNLSRLVSEVVTVQKELAAQGGRVVEMQIAPNVHIQATESEIRQVVLNLLINALAATSENGRIDVMVRAAGTWAEIELRDDGRGMSAEQLQRIFEPFYTTSQVGQLRGTGLGLSISQAIVQNHGGAIEAHSDGVGQGSSFTIRLPLHAGAPADART